MVLYICALDDIRCRCDLCGCERVSPYWDMATRWQGKRKCSMWTGLARLSDDLSLRIATTKRIFFSQIMKQINFSVGVGVWTPSAHPRRRKQCETITFYVLARRREMQAIMALMALCLRVIFACLVDFDCCSVSAIDAVPVGVALWIVEGVFFCQIQYRIV